MVIEHLHMTSPMTSPMVAAMLEIFFHTVWDVLIEVTLENGRK
jgi:rRNA pseudouridine-1189 N-methylase Emg1 (Nep1/Mra1 family)